MLPMIKGYHGRESTSNKVLVVGIAIAYPGVCATLRAMADGTARFAPVCGAVQRTTSGFLPGRGRGCRLH